MDALLKRCGCGALLRKPTMEEEVKCGGCGEEWPAREGIDFSKIEKSPAFKVSQGI